MTESFQIIFKELIYMNMNEIVRERRKALGMTQEQVADCLGVSAPAVNKWEKGATYPDISLLPALARLLGIDVNTLFCFNESLSQKEIGLFLNKVVEVQKASGLDAEFVLAMEKVREYPTCAELLHMLALTLQGSLMMAHLDDESQKPYDAQILSLYERVAKCGDEKYSKQANYMLASRLISEKQYEKAQELLDALPEYNALDKRGLQASLWVAQDRTNDAAKLLEHKLISALNDIQATLISLAKIAVKEGDFDTEKQLAKCGQSEAEVFGLWGYSAYIVPLEVAVTSKNVVESLDLLEKMLAAALMPWDVKKSPLYKHIEVKENGGNLGAQMMPSLISELEKSEEYEFLRGEEKFKRMIEKYK